MALETDRYSTVAFETVRSRSGDKVVPITAVIARTVRPSSTVRGIVKRMGFVQYGLDHGNGFGLTQTDALSVVERLKVSPDRSIENASKALRIEFDNPVTASSTLKAKLFKRPIPKSARPARAPQPPGLMVTPKPEIPKTPGLNPPPASSNPIAQAINNLKAACEFEGFVLTSVVIAPTLNITGDLFTKRK